MVLGARYGLGTKPAKASGLAPLDFASNRPRFLGGLMPTLILKSGWPETEVAGAAKACRAPLIIETGEKVGFRNGPAKF